MSGSKYVKVPRRKNNFDDSEAPKGVVNRSAKFLLPVISVIFLSFIMRQKGYFKSAVTVNQPLVAENSRRLRYWNICHATWNPSGNLRTMNRVFDRLGYELVNPYKGDDWDVLWTFEYPYDIEDRPKCFDPIYSKPLQPHQKINHIPGISVLTNKSHMTALNRDLPFILPSFTFATKDKFKKYTAENPKRKFVEKSYTNRGVKIIDKNKINFKKPATMYQAFLENPLLVDGHAFDMGIYVLISSFDPVRAYRWHSDILMRFCPEPYHPFDPLNIEKYVIYETHKHFSEMPSFKPYIQHTSYTLKSLFANYLKKQGHDIKTIFKQVDEIIAVLLLRTEKLVIQESLRMLNSTRHTFDLVRFDFLIDETLKVYLMEINLSPNITPSSKKYEVNAKFREQMVHDALRLVGASSYLDLMHRYDPMAKAMMSHIENIAVTPEQCYENYCDENCHLELCEHCVTCLSEHMIESLYDAQLEHRRRGGFKRAYPRDFLKYDDVAMNNRIQFKWFNAKCEEDVAWC